MKKPEFSPYVLTNIPLHLAPTPSPPSQLYPEYYTYKKPKWKILFKLTIFTISQYLEYNLPSIVNNN